MTVKELIEMLSQFDEDKDVLIKTSTFHMPILGVEHNDDLGIVVLDPTW